jgi:hypothetical protein
MPDLDRTEKHKAAKVKVISVEKKATRLLIEIEIGIPPALISFIFVPLRVQAPGRRARPVPLQDLPSGY